MSERRPRVAFRFELDDQAPFLSHLCFESDAAMPRCRKRVKEASEKPADAAAPDDSPRKATTSSAAADAQKESRGLRRSAEIVVESYAADDGALAATKQASDSSETLDFFSGNPFIEKTEGLMHVYKRDEAAGADESAEGGRSVMVCMVGVPAVITCSELLQFVAPVSAGVQQMRIVRSQAPNQYMVLVRFRSQSAADSFYDAYNGTQFNSIEQDVCNLVFVDRIEVMKESHGGSLPVDGYTELPTCPVCLERMDESLEGVLTILCNHSFHGSCLSQWSDSSCPVCRYCQTPELTAEHKCFVCQKQEDLWICLICGHVGCGRYAGAHAHAHFSAQSHTFAMQIGGARVWDYAADNYVHRLIQSKTDGKVVEFEPNQRSPDDLESEEKAESLTLEYTHLLSSQLEAQRMYFEERLSKVEKIAQAQIEELEAQVRRAADECERLRAEVSSLAADKRRLEQSSAAATEKAARLVAELREERDVNGMLRVDQLQCVERVNGLEAALEQAKAAGQKEVEEMREQMRDLMFHLEASEKVKSTELCAADEIQEGSIVLGDSTTTQQRLKRTKKKK